MDIHKSGPSYLRGEKKKIAAVINRARQLKRQTVQSFHILILLFGSDLKLYYLFLLTLLVP